MTVLVVSSQFNAGCGSYDIGCLNSNNPHLAQLAVLHMHFILHVTSFHLFLCQVFHVVFWYLGSSWTREPLLFWCYVQIVLKVCFMIYFCLHNFSVWHVDLSSCSIHSLQISLSKGHRFYCLSLYSLPILFLKLECPFLLKKHFWIKGLVTSLKELILAGFKWRVLNYHVHSAWTRYAI